MIKRGETCVNKVTNSCDIWSEHVWSRHYSVMTINRKKYGTEIVIFTVLSNILLSSFKILCLRELRICNISVLLQTFLVWDTCNLHVVKKMKTHFCKTLCPLLIKNCQGD